MQTLEELEGLRTFHSRNSHSSAGVADVTGWAEGIAHEQIQLHYSLRGGGVMEPLETFCAQAF